MLQTLFYIPRTVWGVPLFGFGLLLAVWLVGGAIVLALQFRRHGWGPDVRSSLNVLLIAAVIVAFVLPTIGDERGVPIQGYGTMLVLAVIAGTALSAWRGWRMGIDPDVIVSVAFWMFVGGIVGGRVLYVGEYWRDYWQGFNLETLGRIARVWEGGLVIYGAAFGGIAAFAWFVWRRGLPGWALADIMTPGTALGLALGRIGCFLNGCCYGGPTDVAWAVQFPEGSPPFERQVREGELYLHGLKLEPDPLAASIVVDVEAGSPAAAAGLRRGDRLVEVNEHKVANGAAALDQLLRVRSGEELRLRVAGRTAIVAWRLPATRECSRPVHPAQLYSALDALIACLFLLAYYPYRRRDGEVFAWALTLHPISRFLQEIVRIDEGDVLGTSLSISQVISLLLLVAAAGVWTYLRGRPRGSLLPVGAPAPA
ncbi:MAG: prolipoprotein diacylglyceryl transferase [Pirellulales bacterium]|nr:prolipoprotein diacylglyceryl transferase [Pirellulales bacterium]